MPARKLSQKDRGANRGRDADEAGSLKTFPSIVDADNQQMALSLEAQTTTD